jgi:hypothetical protein
MIEGNGGIMVKLSEMELKMLIKGGETNTVELKLAAPRAVDLAERLCGMANARGGIVIIGVEDSTHKVVGVPDERIGETMDVILRGARQVIKPELVLDPPEPEFYVLARNQDQPWKQCQVWREACNEHDVSRSYRLLSCLLAVAGGSTCLLKRCLCGVS